MRAPSRYLHEERGVGGTQAVEALDTRGGHGAVLANTTDGNRPLERLERRGDRVREERVGPASRSVTRGPHRSGWGLWR